MKYEVAINTENSKTPYIKVRVEEGQKVITPRKVNVNERLFYKLFYDSYDNFIFYKDGVRVFKEIKITPLVDEEKQIEKVIETPKKEKGFKKFLDKIF